MLSLHSPALLVLTYTVVRPICELESRYFEGVYRSPACRVELYVRAKGIVQGFWRLYTDDFYAIGVPVPPITEQTQIMDHLNGALEKQNIAIARTEREIALMQEYRTRLTADIMTGKLDVRDAAAKLPDVPVCPAEASVPDIDDIDEGLPQESETELEH